MVSRHPALGFVAILTAALAVAVAPVASSATVPAHYPIGHQDSARATGVAGPSVPTGWHSGSYINAAGWSFDPDAKSTSEVVRSYDGSTVKWHNYTKGYRPDVNRVYGLTGYHGYSTRYPVANGRHRICTYQESIGVGASDWSNCIYVAVNGSPYGSFDSLAWSSPTSLRISGWAADPDDTRVSTRIQYTIDGAAATSVVAGGARPDVNSAVKIPGSHGFSVNLNLANYRSHTVCVTATNYGPSAPNALLGCKTVSPAAAPPPLQSLTWKPTASRPAVPTGASLQSVSCVSAVFCIAVDSGANAYSFDGTTWSAPARIVGANELQAVSCSSTIFCVAVDRHGNAATFDGSAWTPAGNVAGSDIFVTVSCVSSSFCIAGDISGQTATSPPTSGRVARYDGLRWTMSTIDTWPISGVSCPATNFCTAVDVYGRALTFNGQTWSQPVAVDQPNTDLDGVSCASTWLCAAVDNHGFAFTYDGVRWSGPTNLVSPGDLSSVSCANSSFCVATAAYTSYTTNGAGWAGNSHIGTNSLTSVSCPQYSYCVVVSAENTTFVGS